MSELSWLQNLEGPRARRRGLLALVAVSAGSGCLLGSGVTVAALERLLKPNPEAVPGFEWSDEKYPPIPEPGGPETWCGFSPSFRERSPGEPLHVGVLSVALESITKAHPPRWAGPLQLGLMYRRGVKDSCPNDGEWHQGMAPPNAVFGRIESHGIPQLLAGIQISVGDGEFNASWALRAGSQTYRLSTGSMSLTEDLLADGAMPLPVFERHFSGVPLLKLPQ